MARLALIALSAAILVGACSAASPAPTTAPTAAPTDTGAHAHGMRPTPTLDDRPDAGADRHASERPLPRRRPAQSGSSTRAATPRALATPPT